MARIDWASSLKLATKILNAMAKLAAVGDETELWASYKGLRFKIVLERVE